MGAQGVIVFPQLILPGDDHYGFALQVNMSPRLDFLANLKRRCKPNFSGASMFFFV